LTPAGGAATSPVEGFERFNVRTFGRPVVRGLDLFRSSVLKIPTVSDISMPNESGAQQPGGEKPWVSQPQFNVYLCALDRYKTVAGEAREGLDALLVECGRRIKASNAPNPAANLPWRSDAALVAARLGEPDRVRPLPARASGYPGRVGGYRATSRP
jgi:hypothetical protein